MNFVNGARAELAKLLTVRLWWILLIVLFVYVGFTAGLLAGVFAGLIDNPPAAGAAPPIDPAGLHLLVYSTATAIGYVFPVLLGALVTTSEYRHQTLTPTFLANPRRSQVLGAKLVALAVIGAVYGVVSLLASVGIGGAVLAAAGQDARLGAEDTWVLIGRVILAMVLWAVIGVGLGTVVPNQVAVIVIVLAFTQFLEPVLRLGASIWEWTAEIGKFLPGAASDALVGSSVFTSLGAGSGAATASLQWWQGGLVLLALAMLTAFIGYFTTWRRDVT